jgi:hypothetical protein
VTPGDQTLGNICTFALFVPKGSGEGALPEAETRYNRATTDWKVLPKHDQLIRASAGEVVDRAKSGNGDRLRGPSCKIKLVQV